MKNNQSNHMVRITATGPYFELDFEVPEKKAAAELKRLKQFLKMTTSQVKERAKVKLDHNGGTWYKLPIGQYQKPFCASEHGISKTTIQVSKVQ